MEQHDGVSLLARPTLYPDSLGTDTGGLWCSMQARFPGKETALGFAYSFSVKITVGDISTKLPNVFSGCRPASAKPHGPTCATPGTVAEWRPDLALLLLTGADRFYRDPGSLISQLCYSLAHDCLPNSLGLKPFLSGVGPCLPKGKVFCRVSARTLGPFLSQGKKKFFS